MVVSFMVAVPSRWVLSSFDSTGPRRRSHRSQQSPSGRFIPHLTGHGPHVGDVVLLNGHREHRQTLFRVRAAAAEGLQRRLRLPALEDVDTAGVYQVRADRDVEAANLSGEPVRRCAARGVGLALLRLNGDVSCNDDRTRPRNSLRRSYGLEREIAKPAALGPGQADEPTTAARERR
jgi:hypothetical protein